MGELLVGCAGWAIPRGYAASFPGEGSHLRRYAGRLSAVEVNTTFYRIPQAQTLARWANEVPEHFRFALKVPRQITHQAPLADPDLLAPFLEAADALGSRLGVLLIQLPPSLAFERSLTEGFFCWLRQRWSRGVVCEPRHPSWFDPATEQLLAEWKVARAAVDPPPVPSGVEPAGWTGLVYYRLHGSPRRYYSSYDPGRLHGLSRCLTDHTARADVWCIFDNTAAGAAVANALDLQALLEQRTGKVTEIEAGDASEPDVNATWFSGDFGGRI